MKAATLATLALMVFAGPAASQTPSRPGPWVLDVHGATSPVPGDPAFYPPFDQSALVPQRGFGVDIGSHVYLFTVGAARFGVGASITGIRAITRPPAPVVTPTPGAPPEPVPPRQSVQIDLRHMAPHVSLNFGTGQGWSYLSGGMGATMVRARTAGVNAGTRETGPLWDFNRLWQVRDYNALHVGGGARWFSKSHLAFSFDVRFYRVSPGTAGIISLAAPVPPPVPEDPDAPVPPVPPPVLPRPTPGLMFLSIGAGLSFR